MSVEANEQEAITAKRSIEQILVEPAFVEAVKRVEKDVVNEFADSETDEQRRNAWAKARALKEVMTELSATVQRGKVAEKLRERREQQEARNRRANPRKSS